MMNRPDIDNANPPAADEASVKTRRPRFRLTGPGDPLEPALPRGQKMRTYQYFRATGGFEHCSDAQAAEAADSLLVIAADVVQAPNNKRQIIPMLNQIDALPDEFGNVNTSPADTGHFSAANVTACGAGSTGSAAHEDV